METQYKKAGAPNNLHLLVEKHKKINKQIEEGKGIDPELSKNFVTFSLSNKPNKG
jgi:hypothetical protein